MVQPIRPHDASGIYRAQGATAGAPAEAAAGGRGRAARARSAGRTDSATFSPRALELARAQQAAAAAPELRAGRIAQVRADLQSGTYRLDPVAIARAMVRGSAGAPAPGDTAAPGDPADTAGTVAP